MGLQQVFLVEKIKDKPFAYLYYITKINIFSGYIHVETVFFGKATFNYHSFHFLVNKIDSTFWSYAVKLIHHFGISLPVNALYSSFSIASIICFAVSSALVI